MYCIEAPDLECRVIDREREREREREEGSEALRDGETV